MSFFSCMESASPFMLTNSSNILKLPEFLRIVRSSKPSETLACGAALNPPPKYMPLATTPIVIFESKLWRPSFTETSHRLLS